MRRRHTQVIVRAEDGSLLARGHGLERGESGPMCFLVRDVDRVRLEDGWPSQDDLGQLVILPGDETGILRSRWHAEDQSEWRWRVQLDNHVERVWPGPAGFMCRRQD